MSESTSHNLSLAEHEKMEGGALKKLGLTGVGLAIFIFVLALFDVTAIDQSAFLTASFVFLSIGGVIFAYDQYSQQPAGIKNNGVWFRSLTNRGSIGWLVGIVLTTFYIALYWFPSWIGKGTGAEGQNEGLVALFDPLAYFFKGTQASEWFVYGTFYTMAILILGVKFLMKYRHSRYHFLRTLVVMASQLFLAYLIPEILEGLNYGGGDNYFGKDLKNMWPLNYYFTDGWYLDNMTAKSEQPLGMIFLVWGIILFVVVTPILTYFLGKRWYCSWICGCGGLAETAGDPFRHLSDKTTEAWNIERVLIHGVLVFVFVMTAMLLTTYFVGFEFKIGINPFILSALLLIGLAGIGYYLRKKYDQLPWRKTLIVGLVIFVGFNAYIFMKSGLGTYWFSSFEFRSWYGFFVGAAFSGVIGVGFYPLLGNRVWCRFGCPLAGYMGLIQRFKSRFRITTNGGQCISCGNCSAYCEQGIDVRAYAQRGQNIVRASCVGCGICAAVCPRGVLKLENGPEENRIGGPIEVNEDGVKVNNE